MKKHIHSFRLDDDIKTAIKTFQKKHPDVSFTDLVNASLHHFIQSNQKKQFKSLRSYKSRFFRIGGDSD